MHTEQAYLFRHALVRDAAYELQLPLDRADLHQLAADVHQSLKHQPSYIADHLRAARALSGGGPPGAREVGFALKAAEAATTGSRYAEAVRYWLTVIEPADAPVALRCKAAKLLELAGKRELALSVAHAARAMATPGSPDELQAANTCAILAHGSSRNAEAIELLSIGRQRGDFDALLLYSAILGRQGKVEEAIAIDRDLMQATLGDPGKRRLVAQNLANKLAQSSQSGEAEQMYREAIALTEGHGPMYALADQYSALALLMLRTSRAAEALQLARSALRVAQEAGLVSSLPSLHQNLGVILQALGQTPQARTAFETAIETATENNQPRQAMLARSALASHLHLIGELATAEVLLRACLEFARANHEPRAEGVTLGNLAELLLDTGRPSEAVEMFHQALAVHEKVMNRQFAATHRCGLGRALISTGQVADGMEQWRTGAALLRELGDMREHTRQADYLRDFLHSLNLAVPDDVAAAPQT